VFIVRSAFSEIGTRDKENAMAATLNFLTLAVTTIFAAGAAALVDWLLLQGALRLMRPAAANRTSNARR
jgi:hypothetical protein